MVIVFKCISVVVRIGGVIEAVVGMWVEAGAAVAKQVTVEVVVMMTRAVLVYGM